VDPTTCILSPGFTAQHLTEFNSKNQWLGPNNAQYDSVGNQQQLTGATSPHLAAEGTYAYDGETRLVTATLNALGTVNYVYAHACRLQLQNNLALVVLRKHAHHLAEGDAGRVR
jgi:hypothetical protein